MSEKMQLKKETKQQSVVLTPKVGQPLKQTSDIIQENQGSAESLIAMAIREKLPVETMERLLAMRKELKAEWAKEQFDKAMAGFQGECPVIKKTKKVMNKDGRSVRYVYAPIDSIVEQVKDMIAKYELSYTIKVRNDGKAMTVVCRVTHKAGHSEDSEFEVPISSEEYMSDVQKFGARSTFAKRYAFCNAFGIMTGDDDDDAQSTIGEKKVLPPAKFQPKMPLVNSKTVPAVDIKQRIKQRIDILISPKKIKTAAEYKEIALKLTQLELAEKNYSEIDSRLYILIKERAETKKFEQDDKTKYSPATPMKLKFLRDLARLKMHLINDKVILEWLEFEYKIKIAKLEALNVKQADQAIDYLLKLKNEEKPDNFKGDRVTV